MIVICKPADTAPALFSAVRTLSFALQGLRHGSTEILRKFFESRHDECSAPSYQQQCGALLVPSGTAAVDRQGDRCFNHFKTAGKPTTGTIQGALGGRLRWLIPNQTVATVTDSRARSLWPSGQLQRSKYTDSSSGRSGRRSSRGGGSAGISSRPGEQKPRRRLPRFKSSPKIINTASLRELGDLAAAEVAGWNAKELAAAARRAVSLWRHEQPKAAARVRRMQRLPLLPRRAKGSDDGADSGGDGSGGGDGGASGKCAGPGRREARAEGARRGGKPGGAGQVARVTLSAEERFGAGGGVGGDRGGAAADVPAAAAAAEAATTTGAGVVDAAGDSRSDTWPAPARRKLTGGAFRTTVVDRPLRPHELRLAQLVERLVRAANGRLAEGFGSRELSSFVWSLVALGYWQPPLAPLVSAFADYGAERLRSADAIAMAMVLQVLAKARAASLSGQPTAKQLLELAPATAAAAAASLPRCLPRCEPRTLSGLLHSCAVLLSPSRAAGQVLRPPADGNDPAAGGPGAATDTAAARRGAGEVHGLEAGESAGHLAGHTAEALAALARDVTRECVRRRFLGFGPTGIVTTAGALAALMQTPALGGGTGGGGGGGNVTGGEEAWALLAAAAVSPLAPQMAGATTKQWALLLRVARLHGGSSQQLLTAGAVSAGTFAESSSRHASRHENGDVAAAEKS